MVGKTRAEATTHLVPHAGPGTLVMPPGHAAVGILFSDRDEALRRFAIVVLAGALLPDVIDKSLLLFRVYPWGRTVGHSVLLWGALAVFAFGARTRALVVGGFSHLLADVVDDLVAGLAQGGHLYSAWAAFPFATADDAEIRLGDGRQNDAAMTALEIATIALALAVGWRRARGRSFSEGIGSTSR